MAVGAATARQTVLGSQPPWEPPPATTIGSPYPLVSPSPSLRNG